MKKLKGKLATGAVGLAALVGNTGCVDVAMFAVREVLAHERHKDLKEEMRNEIARQYAYQNQGGQAQQYHPYNLHYMQMEVQGKQFFGRHNYRVQQFPEEVYHQHDQLGRQKVIGDWTNDGFSFGFTSKSRQHKKDNGPVSPSEFNEIKNVFSRKEGILFVGALGGGSGRQGVFRLYKKGKVLDETKLILADDYVYFTSYYAPRKLKRGDYVGEWTVNGRSPSISTKIKVKW